MRSTQFNQKKRFPLWGIIGIAVLALVLVAGGGTGYYIWARQREKDAANEAVNAYITALEEQDYSAMSEAVSQSSLDAIDYTREIMAERYETVYGGVGVSITEIADIETSLDDETDGYIVDYTVEMETSLGELEPQTFSATLSEGEDGYLVDWSADLIFPDMEATDKVILTTSSGERGDLLARDGTPLATEGTVWEAGLHPVALGEGTELTANLEQISSTFDVSVEQLETVLSAEWVTEDSFVPFKVISDGETPQVTGVLYQETVMRTYPLNEAAAHLIGYVGEVSAEDIENNPTLRSGETVGKAGLEAAFDERLRGQRGGRIVINDNEDNLKRVLQENEVQDGEDITLTIDAEIQQASYDQISSESGAVVFMNPQTGDLLALVSSPSYDANLMTSGISSEQYQAYLDDPQSPFLSRFASRYAPGSTFKPITAGIGLDSGILTPDKTLEVDGLTWQKDSSWGDHYITRVTAVPSVDLEDALVYSDNIYFAREALEMGQTVFEEGLSRYLFGEELNLPISMNVAQISNEGTLDSEGLLADTAFGQGQLLMNPIQMAASYTPFANSGQLVYPKLTSDQETAEPKQPVTSESVEIITSALIQSVQSSNGTAHDLATIDQMIAAKTGTAETVEGESEEDGFETNGLLLAFDAENSSYLMVAVIEGASGGTAVSAMKPVLEQIEELN